MAITNRNLKGGETLTAKYHGKEHTAKVVKTADGIRFVVDGSPTEHKSPSSAGAAVFGLNKEGKPRTCNGWVFWSVAEVATPKPATSKAASKTPKATKPAPAPTDTPKAKKAPAPKSTKKASA
jgi:hypothetical protein